MKEGLPGGKLQSALADYQSTRDETSLPLYELNSQLAALGAPPPELQALIGALASNQADTNRFIGALCGTVPVREFLAPENVARIVADAEIAAVPS